MYYTICLPISNYILIVGNMQHFEMFFKEFDKQTIVKKIARIRFLRLYLLRNNLACNGTIKTNGCFQATFCGFYLFIEWRAFGFKCSSFLT